MKLSSKKFLLLSALSTLFAASGMAGERVCGTMIFSVGGLDENHVDVCAEVLEETPSWRRYKLETPVKAGFILGFRQINANRVCRILGGENSVFFSMKVKRSNDAVMLSGLEAGIYSSLQAEETSIFSANVVDEIKCK